MIELVIFELGSALVQLEALDARAYAEAALALRPELSAEAVGELCCQLGDLARPELARRLIRQFDLHTASQALAHSLALGADWQALLMLRAQAYERLFATPEAISAAAWPDHTAPLYTARRMGCRLALVANSARSQVTLALDALALADSFDLILTREEAEYGPADPALHLSAALALDLAPASCLSVCRSLFGVRAALAAGITTLAVAPPASRRHFVPYQSSGRCTLVDSIAALPGHLYAQLADLRLDD